MNEKILNKKCFIRSQADNRVYCGKTGEIVCQDIYNLKKKAEKNGYLETDAQKFVKKWAKIKKLQLNTLDLNI